MAELAGARLADASGNGLLDGSSNAIIDQNIPVTVGALGALYTAAVGGGKPWWMELLDRLEDATDFAQWIFDVLNMANLTNGVDQILSNQQKLAYVASAATETYENGESTYTGNTLRGILDAIDEIEPGGGLTQEEHDKLVGLENIDYEQIAGDVWGFTLSVTDANEYDKGPMAQTVLTESYAALVSQMAYDGIPLPDNPYFRKVFFEPGKALPWLGYWTDEGTTGAVPVLDLSLVEEGDTVWSFLTREYPGYDWHQDGPGAWGTGGSVWVWSEPWAGTVAYRCTLTDADLVSASVLNVVNNITTTSGGAPVWPGLEGVTLGSNVALTDQLVLDGPMHGILIAVTTPPSGLGRYSIGGNILDYSVGRVTFGTDNGQLEPWQYLGFRSAIFTPKTMEQADHAYFQVLGGAGGTVRTWLRS